MPAAAVYCPPPPIDIFVSHLLRQFQKSSALVHCSDLLHISSLHYFLNCKGLESIRCTSMLPLISSLALSSGGVIISVVAMV